MKMRKFIKDLRQNDSIEEVFLLRKKEMGKTKEGKPYLKLEFLDKTGTIDGRLWNNAESIDECITDGMIVLVKGSIDSWQNILQIKVEDVRAAEEEEFHIAELIRAIDNVDEIFAAIKSMLRKNIGNTWVSRLMMAFLDDGEFVERFKRSPGARSWHNAYAGGLLEHTYEVMTIVEKMCDLYSEIHRDIAMVGAFLHDMGKIYELDATTFEYTDEGNLLGHLPIGFDYLSRKIVAIPDFPEDIAVHLKHIILSHHGEYDQQSPVLPKTLEAIVVYHADDLVSQANAVKEIMHTPGYQERDWSNYVGIKGRKFFLKRLEL